MGNFRQLLGVNYWVGMPLFRSAFLVIAIALLAVDSCVPGKKASSTGFPVRLLPLCVLEAYPDPGEKPMTVIEFFPDQEPEINGVPTSEARLLTELRNRTQTRSLKEVYLLTNDNVLYGHFVQILDRIVLLKLDRVVLLTKSSGLDLSNGRCRFDFSY